MGIIADQVEAALRELVAAGRIRRNQIVVIGASTSEVTGRKIGTSGAWDVAEQIVDGVERVQAETGFFPAYQCCEHLNRALVANRALLGHYPALVEVSAVPVPKAGGATAACAYRRLRDPCLVESIQAHAAIDIGDTLIGMHLRRVAVPFRPSVRRIGEANVNLAYARPPYTGGPRAVYSLDAPESSAGMALPDRPDNPASPPATGVCD